MSVLLNHGKESTKLELVSLYLGYEISVPTHQQVPHYIPGTGIWVHRKKWHKVYKWWNPLNDLKDTFELMVDLGLTEEGLSLLISDREVLAKSRDKLKAKSSNHQLQQFGLDPFHPQSATDTIKRAIFDLAVQRALKDARTLKAWEEFQESQTSTNVA